MRVYMYVYMFVCILLSMPTLLCIDLFAEPSNLGEYLSIYTVLDTMNQYDDDYDDYDDDNDDDDDGL